MRQVRQVLRGALVVTATVAVGLGVAPVAAHAGSGPAIVVTPSRGLVSGQTVHVTGSGFRANSRIAGVECPVGANDPTDCDLDNLALVTADAHGDFTTTFVIHRTLLAGNGFVDCAPNACVLAFALTQNFKVHATEVLRFDPKVPLPPTTVSVTPATHLADGQELKLVATGFTADPQVYVTECVVDGFNCAPAVGVFTRPNGSLSTRFAAQRVITDNTGNRVDCASSAGACEILVVDLANVDYRASAPLDFDPNLPPPPAPTANVHPSTNLPYYARVTVFGKHWSPSDFIDVLECQTKEALACTELAFVQSDANGVLQAQPMLEREFVDDFDPGGTPIDCAAPHAACVLVALSGLDGSRVTVPVTFDPHAPIPPKPSATVHPAAPYQDSQTVTITGKNFAPRAGFSISECAISPSSEACLTEGGGGFTTATGGLSGSFQLFRALDPEDPTSDCTATGVECLLEIASEGGATVAIPLTFSGGAASTAPHAHATFVRHARRAAPTWATHRRRAIAILGVPNVA